MIEQAGKQGLICIQSRGPKKPNDHDRSPKFPEKAVSHQGDQRSLTQTTRHTTHPHRPFCLPIWIWQISTRLHLLERGIWIKHCGFEPGSVAAAVTRTGWEKLEWSTMQTTTVIFLFAKPTSLPQSTLSTSTSLIFSGDHGQPTHISVSGGCQFDFFR